MCEQCYIDFSVINLWEPYSAEHSTNRISIKYWEVNFCQDLCCVRQHFFKREQFVLCLNSSDASRDPFHCTNQLCRLWKYVVCAYVANFHTHYRYWSTYSTQPLASCRVIHNSLSHSLPLSLSFFSFISLNPFPSPSLLLLTTCVELMDCFGWAPATECHLISVPLDRSYIRQNVIGSPFRLPRPHL